MIRSLLQIIFSFIKRDLIVVKYKKIESPPDLSAGYVDVEEIKKRYKSTGQNVTTKELKGHTPVRDALLFINENIKYFSGKLDSGCLLDVGCGNGLYSKVFSEKNNAFTRLKYHGLEINNEFVSICKELNPGKIFFDSLAQNIKAVDNKFEVVYCSGTLHYTLKNWKKTVRELARVSSKYILVMRHPVSKYSKSFYVEQKVVSKTGIERHYFIVTNRQELENEFTINGLRILSRDYSSEEYKIEGNAEKIVLVEYLLSK